MQGKLPADNAARRPVQRVHRPVPINPSWSGSDRSLIRHMKKRRELFRFSLIQLCGLRVCAVFMFHFFRRFLFNLAVISFIMSNTSRSTTFCNWCKIVSIRVGLTAIFVSVLTAALFFMPPGLRIMLLPCGVLLVLLCALSWRMDATAKRQKQVISRKLSLKSYFLAFYQITRSSFTFHAIFGFGQQVWTNGYRPPDFRKLFRNIWPKCFGLST